MSNIARNESFKRVPYGLVVTRSWLLSQGLDQHRLDNWVKSNQLISIAHGVYSQPEAKLTWKAVVCSLQRMESDLCLGGLLALELQGLSHYATQSPHKTIDLYGNDKLPTWINKILEDVQFIHHSSKQVSDFTISQPLGIDDRILTMSSPERAIFEVLRGVPESISFEHVDNLMQGLYNLSPRRLNTLLEKCSNIKVLRLFLWFAERHKHAWLKKIDLEHFNIENGTLGSGKRMIAKGGKLDKKYLITVPKEMHG